MSVTFDWYVYLNLSGTAWTDVSADVLTSPIIHGDYGIKGAGPIDRVASGGRASFVLDNSEKNSASTVGYYSPGHASCRVGFDTGINVKIVIGYGSGRTKVRFYGKIAPNGIDVLPGTYGKRTVNVTAYDYMEDCNVHEITLPELQVDKTIDEAVPFLTAMLPREPKKTSYASGAGTFPYVFDLVRTGGKVTTELQRLAMSEIGYAFPRYEYHLDGECLVIQSRNTRGAVVGYEQVPSGSHGTIYDHGGSAILDHNGESILDSLVTDAVFTNSQTDMDVTRGDNLYNKIKVITYPRQVVAGTILWAQDKEISLAGGGTFLIRGTYRDPNGAATKCGGMNVVTPVGTTDYTMYSATGGGGSAMTEALSIESGTAGSYDFEYLIKNNSAAKGYINLFQVRGDGIYTYNQSESVRTDSASEGIHGTRVLNYDMKYEEDATLPYPYAGVMLNRHKDPLTQIKTVKYCANSSDQLMEYFMAIEPGAKIKLTETVSGQDTDYFVQGISWDIIGGKKLDVTYYVKRVDIETSSYQFHSGTVDCWDTWIRGPSNITTNYGTDTTMLCGTTTGEKRKALIKFDFSSIGTAAVISSSKMYLYDAGSYGGTANVYRLTQNWEENQATGTIYSTGNAWGGTIATGTADFNSNVLCSKTIPDAEVPGWIEFDLNTSYVKEMIDGSMQNYGFVIDSTNNPNSSIYLLSFYSSEYSDSTKRPYMIINYLL